ncbi:hypothetical protein [Oceanivirga salmonicida]|uniref:hypothetical protein n=1 Tax=Oceanivirga salmonicida TaxID=1769291 RepID=UPI0012E14CDD|nr:hypothetical protein [Oceanivirga salmonicida]
MNKGFNFIELVIVMFLITFSIFISYVTYYNIVNRIQSYKVKIEIISIINSKYKEINFNLENKKIFAGGKMIKLNDRFNYESKNISNTFTRTFNENGNLDKGFTILIKDKNNKILQTIIYNTNSGLDIPILREEK